MANEIKLVVAKMGYGHLGRTLTACKLGYKDTEDCTETLFSAFLHKRRTPLKFETCRQDAIVPAYQEIYHQGHSIVASAVQFGPLLSESGIRCQPKTMTCASNMQLIPQFTPDFASNVITKKVLHCPLYTHYLSTKEAEFESRLKHQFADLAFKYLC
jgi:hypothetical protein